MKTFPFFWSMALAFSFTKLISAEELFGTHTLRNFQKTEHWHLAKSVAPDEKEPRHFVIEPEKKGKLLVNSIDRVKRLPYLFTKDEYGDVDVSLEFMIPKGSNSGVYLMGRYEVQITDSFGKDDHYSDENAQEYAGVPPIKNAAKASGEWQKLDIKFRAPRFSKNQKTTNALLESVHLNGTLVQKNVSVTGPTVSHPLKGEEKKDQ